MVLTNVYGAALTIRASVDGAAREPRPPPADRLGGRPQGRRRVALLLHEVGRDGDGGGRPPGAARQRRPRDPALAGDRETPFYDDPVGGEQLTPEDVARAVMFAPSAAAPRRRQRDPDAPDHPGVLRALRGGRGQADRVRSPGTTRVSRPDRGALRRRRPAASAPPRDAAARPSRSSAASRPPRARAAPRRAPARPPRAHPGRARRPPHEAEVAQLHQPAAGPGVEAQRGHAARAQRHDHVAPARRRAGGHPSAAGGRPEHAVAADRHQQPRAPGPGRNAGDERAPAGRGSADRPAPGLAGHVRRRPRRPAREGRRHRPDPEDVERTSPAPAPGRAPRARPGPATGAPRDREPARPRARLDRAERDLGAARGRPRAHLDERRRGGGARRDRQRLRAGRDGERPATRASCCRCRRTPRPGLAASPAPGRSSRRGPGGGRRSAVRARARRGGPQERPRGPGERRAGPAAAAAVRARPRARARLRGGRDGDSWAAALECGADDRCAPRQRRKAPWSASTWAARSPTPPSWPAGGWSRPRSRPPPTTRARASSRRCWPPSSGPA